MVSVVQCNVGAEDVRTEKAGDEGRPDERPHGVAPQSADARREDEAQSKGERYCSRCKLLVSDGYRTALYTHRSICAAVAQLVVCAQETCWCAEVGVTYRGRCPGRRGQSARDARSEA